MPSSYVPISNIIEQTGESSRVIHDIHAGMKAYELEVYPTTLSFGPVALNQTSQSKTVTIRNIGYRTVTLTEVFGVGDFTYTMAAPATLVPGAHFTVDIAFHALRTGTSTGGLVISTEAYGPKFVMVTGST